jgi:hypothetical protein
VRTDYRYVMHNLPAINYKLSCFTSDDTVQTAVLYLRLDRQCYNICTVKNTAGWHQLKLSFYTFGLTLTLQEFNNLCIHPLYFTSLKAYTCLTETRRTLCIAQCNILVCILWVLLLGLICLFVWRLKVTNANFCNVQQHKTKTFAIHFAVTFFLEFKTANFLRPKNVFSV